MKNNSKFKYRYLVMIMLITLVLSCHRYQPYVNPDTIFAQHDIPADMPEYSVIFSGNFNKPDPTHPNLRLFREMMLASGNKSATILTGNYVYPLGLPDEEHKNYDEATLELSGLLDTFENYGGELFLIPGNRDWKNGAADGVERVRNLETYVEAYLDRGNIFLPDQGCPGPLEIPLSDEITLIVFDSQWELQDHSKSDLDFDCDFDDLETEADYRNEILILLRDALERNKNKQVIFAAHHSLYSMGRHGGHFPPEENIFPLLALNKYLWFPLPGFLYTGYRKALGNYQDLAQPDYRLMRESLKNIFKNYPNVVYLSAQDKNLQYVAKDGLHHIVSGSATQSDYARKSGKTDFAFQSTGIGRLNYYDNGDVWLQFVVPDSHQKQGKVVFETKLYNKPVKPERDGPEQLFYVDYSDSTVIRRASEQYEVGKLTRFMKGENYRAEWYQPTKIRVFDIASEQGGLEILKRGGGQQTKSVRMQTADGRQYVLRSTEKYVEGAVDQAFWNTIAEDVIQDAISQSHPYGALAMPPLADAVGVYHTNPEIVFVPDDRNLGVYRPQLSERIFLFEERPAGNRADVASFGRPEDIESTAKVLKKMENNHHHQVDQQSVLQARLFDMVIADWDRHDDQWRWAEFGLGNETIYKPIPRDRDNAFFVSEGPVLWIAKGKNVQPKFQGFDYDTKNIPGFNFNARYFDRSFLNMTTREQWHQTALQMQLQLTDQVIEDAIKNSFPDGIYEISGDEIVAKLKSRRDKLPRFADEYYLSLAKAVDIPGTDDRDYFLVERLNDNETKVTAWEMSQKKGKIKDVFYERTFLHNETKEIRIYGRKDQDLFVINGDVDKGIKVRIIGGKGKDTIIDHSHVKGWSHKTLVYDKKDKPNYLVKSSETKDMRSNRPGVNKYDRKQFKYNKLMPQVYMGYSIDDGVFIGGGVFLKNYNFRDSTFHRLIGNYGYETSAFNIKYNGLLSSFIGSLDLLIEASMSAPNVVGNFYGFGNESENNADKNGELDRDYYRVRYHYGLLKPQLRKTISEKLAVNFGGSFIFGKVEDTPDRFISDFEENGLTEDIFMDQCFAGVNIDLEYDSRNDELFPVRGIYWLSTARQLFGLNTYSGNLTELRTDFSVYLSMRKEPRFILALRGGGGYNWGDYPFYAAQGLGGKTNLRGFRANRFTGDGSFYQNTELRLKLFRLNGYILNGNLGLLGFNDLGRVWYKDENSKKWHHGYGFGLWMIPYNMLTLSVNYNMSVEEAFVNFKLSYQF